MSWWTNLVGTVQKDEKWLVAEIAKGWAALQKAEKTIELDVEAAFKWIADHQQSILTLFQGVLGELALVGSVVPAAAPAVLAATAAINAATAAVNVLSKGITHGSTPLSTVVNAYHAVKDAQTAVNAVLKQGTANPKP